jgi:hypothetical protein
MNTSILVLLGLLVVVYFVVNRVSSKTEGMSLLRFRPVMSGQPASIHFDENIAGIPNHNSHEVMPNVNQYANNVAFEPNNPHSANYTQNGRSVLNPPAYQYLGNGDLEDN